MSPIPLRGLGIPRNQPEERRGLFKSRIPGFRQYDEWQDTEKNHSHTPINLPIQQRPQNRGLDLHGSSTSDPPTPQIPVPVEYGAQEVQPVLKLGNPRGKLPEDISQRDFLQRTHGIYQGLESQQEIQTLKREGSQNQGESSHNPGYRGAMDPEREYSY
ncbi:hypothetical protein O181_072258 [Austropuccinia psidii MF-1]|uniref:Uncharacterized protein n=1 Tax=Austropuccinia psidii MF-1 TaxID=1389203 RepID=A0A9Q3F738_9BASI|nr:hypothetical protein [Austropuccinia psidii MF-1]